MHTPSRFRRHVRQPLWQQAIGSPARRQFSALLLGLVAGLWPWSAWAAQTVRVATFNVSLYGEQAGEVLARLQNGDDSQARHLAEIIQRVRPDVLLLNEIDYDSKGEVLQTFVEKYLAVGQHISKYPGGPAAPIAFAHKFIAPVNTGRQSGLDLDRSGDTTSADGNDAYAADCWGYGRYEGQYGMAILSNLPIDQSAVRTFRNFRWKDMPGALLPDDPATPTPDDWYSAEAMEKLPLSSKSHWDVPVLVKGKRIHLLASHPTPPVYDGAEDRNGRRNHDELRFWTDYVGLVEGAAYIYDDAGRSGGLKPQASRLEPSFIVLGDLNSDPHDGDGPEGIRQLLKSPRLLNYSAPASSGAAEQSRLQEGANARHKGEPQHDTCDPADKPGPGNLRIDYVLPSADVAVKASGVFWPTTDSALFSLVGVHPFPSSDHRLVWVDISVRPSGASDQVEPSAY